MRQYLEIKAQYADSILMFRMGDFYEMFFEDAVEVGPVLDIAVTTRDKNVDDPVPMAGVPYHSIGGYLRTLVERGYKVAICEQLETPEDARKRKGPKIVKRGVVRVVTPGALVDEEHLQRGEPNYLVAVVPVGKGPSKAAAAAAAVAALDISSGEFVVEMVSDHDTLRAELARLAPREIVGAASTTAVLAGLLGPDCPRLESQEAAEARGLVSRVRKLAEESGTGKLADGEVEAAARCLAYAEATQPGQTLLLHRLRRHDPGGHLLLDETSLRNLEIFATIRDGQRKGSVAWAIDATRTAMGARLLRGWLGAPLQDRERILARQEGIAALVGESRLRSELQSRLKDVRDVIRLAARARLKSINPRELGALRASLVALPELRDLLDELRSRRTDAAIPGLLDIGEDLLVDIREELARSLVDDPPAVSRDGGMIREGADPELDEQRTLRDGGREALAEIERREREATGIPKLKVKHNNVFGYFIEVSRSHLAKVPKDYVRKQTLVNAERFVTEELAELESKVLGAQAQALARELDLFEKLRDTVSEAGERLIEVGERLATLDVLAGLAEIAERHDYVRPSIVEDPVLEIEEGRHAVVERMLDSGSFVPNDLTIEAQGGGETARFLVITGPNMGGKSTVMRQVALIAILAHIGSFVPARSATIGLVDRVFTRVGAADDLGPWGIHLHGRDARDGADPLPGHRSLAGAARRDRSRHRDLRRAGPRLGHHRVSPRPGRLPHHVRYPLPRAVWSGGPPRRGCQRARRGTRAARQDRVPAPHRDRPRGAELRHPGGASGRSARPGAPPGHPHPRAPRIAGNHRRQRPARSVRPAHPRSGAGFGGSTSPSRKPCSRTCATPTSTISARARPTSC